jgi:hypothetical protein
VPRETAKDIKKNSWTGYKLHIDATDGGIPISCALTSALVHGGQAAIPLAKISHSRVTHLCDLMDTAYDVPAIHEISRQLGHIPLEFKSISRKSVP